VQIWFAFCSGVVIAIAGLTLSNLQFRPLTGSLLSAPGMMEIFCVVGTLSIYIHCQSHLGQERLAVSLPPVAGRRTGSYLVWHNEPGLPMLAGGSLIMGSGLLIALAARNTQVALGPTSPVDEAYARFSGCQSAAPLARPDWGFQGLILEMLPNPKSMSALGCRRPFVIGADGAERHRSNCANKPTIKPCRKLSCTIPYAG
jgi:hypothetical protein